MTKTYDAIIIGTGQAGPFLAQRLAGTGMKVAIIERKLFGGTCVNTGCTPTTAMVASAYAAHMVRRAADFGVVNNGPVSVDMKLVKSRKEMPQLSSAQHEQIEKLAYRLWEERGRPLGSPDDDWFRAEQELIERSDSPSRLTFSSLNMEPVEY